MKTGVEAYKEISALTKKWCLRKSGTSKLCVVDGDGRVQATALCDSSTGIGTWTVGMTTFIDEIDVERHFNRVFHLEEI